MKKVVLFVLGFVLICSLSLLFVVYNKNLRLKEELVTSKNDIKDKKEEVKNIAKNINDLEIEKENLTNQKKEQIKQYEKWIRQNQNLEDLLK